MCRIFLTLTFVLTSYAVVQTTSHLFDRDLEAGSFEVLDSSLSVLLGDSLLDSLRETADEFLGFLEADTGETTDSLKSGDTLRVINTVKNDVKCVFGCLFLGSTASSSWSTASHHHDSASSGRSVDTEGLLNFLNKLRSFEEGHGLQLLDNLGDNRRNLRSTLTIVDTHVSELASGALDMKRPEASHPCFRGDHRASKVCPREGEGA
mmetsp:Transcript_27371/g.66570  ORF Transcript_27371/g.66570 Transcript_27371/m.66570 type:complete len:207 (+) Transcript_27371:325-945(+)